MNLGEHIDYYCERTSTAFWAEPLNAASNIAYFVAAFALWRLLRRHADVPVSIGFMAPGMALIGAGSIAFHTVATRWAYVLDVTPIRLFLLCYLASFLRWFYRLPWRSCLLGGALFVGLTVAFGSLVGDAVPNRSGTYVPALLLIIGIVVTLHRSRDESRTRYWRDFAAAGAVFAAALTARTVDESVCGAVPVGTHFTWHLLSGCLLFLVSRALIRRWQALVDAGEQPPAMPALSGN